MVSRADTTPGQAGKEKDIRGRTKEAARMYVYTHTSVEALW